MFGMLDYRAHKLYWLLNLPLIIVSKISFYLIIILSIVIAEKTAYGVLVKIAIAYLCMEGICLLIIQKKKRLNKKTARGKSPSQRISTKRRTLMEAYPVVPG
jgi:hypothetical protein